VTAPAQSKSPFPTSATVTLGFSSGPSPMPGHNAQSGAIYTGMREHALGQPRHKGTHISQLNYLRQLDMM
jgi:hypothetical protein